MKLIVDSNIVFSAMLNPRSSIGDILLNSQDKFNFYGCNYLREEINEHKDKIIKIGGYDEPVFEEIKFLLYNQITFFSESTIPFQFWKGAADFVREVDMDDISYVALCLFLDERLWTGDKRLIQGLLQKGFKNIITTEEILQLRRTIGM